MKLGDHNRRNKEKAENASRYLERRNYEAYQKNGQRVSIHRTMEVQEDCSGRLREVFIGKLPRDLFEDELLPTLERAGRIKKLRLMMDFSGSNRGFAFAEYASPAEAERACKLLKETLIRDGEPPIGVVPSFDNKKLFLSNLPTKISEDKLAKELGKIIAGVESIQLQACSPKVKSRNAFVTFQTHEAATQARRILCPDNIMICDRIVSVDWARPSKPEGHNSSLQPSSPTTLIHPVLGHSSSINQIQSSCITNRNNNNNNSISTINLNNSISQNCSILTNNNNENIDFNQIVDINHNVESSTDSCWWWDNGATNSSNNTTIISNISSIPFSPSPGSVTSILGEKARQMLAACPPDPQCTTIVENINLHILDHNRLKAVLQFVDSLTVTKVVACAPATLEVTYETPSQAKLMADLMNRFPASFKRLAVPGRQLVARQIAMPLLDYNNNYIFH